MTYTQRNIQISIFLSVLTITLIIAFYYLLRPDSMPQLRSFTGIVKKESRYTDQSTLNYTASQKIYTKSNGFSISENNSGYSFQTDLVEKITPVKIVEFRNPVNNSKSGFGNLMASNTVYSTIINLDFNQKSSISFYKSDIVYSDIMRESSMTMQSAPVLPGSMTDPTTDYTAPIGGGFWILLAYVLIYALFKLKQRLKIN